MHNWSGMKIESVDPTKVEPHPVQKVHFSDKPSPGLSDIQASMARSGLMNPILLYQEPGSKKLICLAGHRRLRSSLNLKWATIDAKVNRSKMSADEQELIILDNNISVRIIERRFDRATGGRLQRMAELIKKIDPAGWALIEHDSMSQKELVSRTGISTNNAAKILAIEKRRKIEKKNNSHARVYPDSIDTTILAATKRSMSLVIRNVTGATKATKIAVAKELRKTVKVIKKVS